ncbi:hypothetical protein N7510_007387 [Penicillium lagena]|uniref:uncharacterized protein n=1 Tax=Penicillium lagena TaxID=94218 RepID=UPI0025402CDA|nr:uncharacterized protein N7510_007387 [Penicillium lagena]KAJ5610668.1 hypothetical protein N7510_007387 [Penicillium lagena]
MANQNDYWPTLRYLKAKEKLNLATSKEVKPSSPSDTTEILDTDFDTDSQDENSEDSANRSVRSLGNDSVTTASTPDDIKTPDSSGLTGFHFQIDDNATSGPQGPHLFRLSDGSFDIKSTVEVDLIFDEAPNSAVTPLYNSASKLGPERRDTPVPARAKTPRKDATAVPAVSVVPAVPDRTNSESSQNDVSNWTPDDVVMWMQKLNIDETVIEKFFINDISGSILLELQADDLKELDIQSFGKRHEIMNSIRQLRYSGVIQPTDAHQYIPSEPVSREATPQSAMADVGISCNATPVNEYRVNGQQQTESERRRQHRRRRPRVIGPNDSVSIVGIEQIMPKIHRCSKGEECRKWQKQYARLSRLSRDLPIESLSGPVVVTGDPGNAVTARNLMKDPKTPKSDVTPSLVASSDALGQTQAAEMPLSKEKLYDVQPRDPQENVRTFLSFQRLSQLQPVNDPATPPRETFPSPDSYSPGTLADNLRTLPKLQIPKIHGPSLGTSTISPNLSGQRTITPGMIRRKSHLQQSLSAHPDIPNTAIFSPSDFYRQDPHYDQSTPFSEMDVPLTAIPIGPVERVFSQSVPPDMRFGYYNPRIPDPITRPVSTKVDNHRRKYSFNNSSLARLDEGQAMEPIETPEDLDRTPRAAHHRVNPFSPSGEYANDIIHSGWVKKRKTTRLLRHEWHENHLALRGTQLSMYPDEEASRRDSKALEHIDVDDYAVACSSLASSSKLTAAFKKTVLKRKDNTHGDTAFAFSLIPSASNASGSDRRSMFFNGTKAHHFAVRTRDERIDWMRELMLAKALRRGRESGASLNVNGNAV